MEITNTDIEIGGSHRAYSPPLSMSCDGLLIAKIDTTWWARSYPIKMAHQFLIIYLLTLHYC